MKPSRFARSYLCCVVKLKARGALNIVVSTIAQRVVRTDEHLDIYQPLLLHHNPRPKLANTDLLTPTRKLDRCELFLVVLLERRSQLGDDIRAIDRESLDVCSLAQSAFWEEEEEGYYEASYRQ